MLHERHMYVTCTSHVRYMYVTCTLHVRHMYVTCTLHVRHMYVTCMSHVCYMYVTCMLATGTITTHNTYLRWVEPPQSSNQHQMLSACKLVYQSIHLGAVPHACLDTPPVPYHALGVKQGISIGWVQVPCQHPKRGGLPSSINP